MEEKKIKVYNRQKFNVGIKTPSKPDGVNIAPGSFTYMSEDDIEYVMSVSTIFQKGYLRVEEQKTEILADMGIDVVNDPNFFDDDMIRKKLALSAKKLGEWLDTVDAEHTRDRIYDIAMNMDLSMSKLKILNEKMPERNILGE